MNSEKIHPPRIDTRKWSCQNIPFPLNSLSKNLLFLSEYSFNYSVKLLFFLWFLCQNIPLPLLIVSDPTCPLSRQWPCQDISLPRQVWRKTDWSAGMLHKLENRHHFEQKIWNTVELQGASSVRWMQKERKDPSWPFDQQRGNPVAGCGHFEQAITLAWRRPVSHYRQSRGEVIGRPIARDGCLFYIFIPNIHQRFDDCVSRESKHSHVSWRSEVTKWKSESQMCWREKEWELWIHDWPLTMVEATRMSHRTWRKSETPFQNAAVVRREQL